MILGWVHRCFIRPRKIILSVLRFGAIHSFLICLFTYLLNFSKVVTDQLTSTLPCFLFDCSTKVYTAYNY